MPEKTGHRITMKQKPLIFIHLSDIHFRKHKHDIYDLDKDLRNELEIDALGMRKKSGGILFGSGNFCTKYRCLPGLWT
jgi:hypothetical protein